MSSVSIGLRSIYGRFFFVSSTLLGLTVALYAIASYGVTGTPIWDVLIFILFFFAASFAIFFSSYDNNLVSPVSFFLLSVFIFIVVRSLLYFIFGMDMVEAGSVGGAADHIFTLNVFLVYYSAIALVFTLIRIPSSIADSLFYLDESYSFSDKFLAFIFLFIALVFLSYFLYSSYVASVHIRSKDYLEVAGSDLVSAHIKYFFFGKWCSVFYLFCSKYDRRFLLVSSVLLFFSVGFMMIGLRGYFFAYFFLFLYFLNSEFKVKVFYLITFAVTLLYFSSVILEYRLGYKIYEGGVDILVGTLHQQGATFEVLHGAVHFLDNITACVDQKGYFSSQTDFGKCVDKSRGISWDYGGFATSFFAEVHYLNVFLGCFLLFVFSFFLRVVDFISYYYSRFGFRYRSVFTGFLIISIIPNLVYFARSDAFDFVVKFGLAVVLCIFTFLISKFLREICLRQQ